VALKIAGEKKKGLVNGGQAFIFYPAEQNKELRISEDILRAVHDEKYLTSANSFRF
jgi:hypothetical protein